MVCFGNTAMATAVSDGGVEIALLESFRKHALIGAY